MGTIKPRTARTVERRALRVESRGPSGRIAKPTFKCGYCQVTCYGLFNWRDHRNSRRHKNKVNPPRLSRCVDCNREFESDEHYYRHLRGKSHIKTVNKQT